MNKNRKDMIRKLASWQSQFLSGDYRLNDWALNALKHDKDEEGEPLIFHYPTQLKAFKFAHQHGVNLLERDSEGYTILGLDDYYDLPTFKWLASIFKEADAIDWAEEEGITPLSGQIKSGSLDRARILLELGASVDTHAEIARYGGARLDIPIQAINVVPENDNVDQQRLGIDALKLLKEFGLSLTRDRKSDLIERSEGKPDIQGWIKENL